MQLIKEQLIEKIKTHYAVIYYDDILLDRMVKLIENLSIFKGTTTSLSIRWLVEKYIVRYSESQDVFYHTIRHMMAVANVSMLLAKDLTQIEKQNLLLAALFHDYEHSLGEATDSYNVAKSIYLSKLQIENMNTPFSSIFGSTQYNINVIQDAIFCTVFPFRVEPKNEIEKILRDADLLMSLCPDVDHFAKGLSLEIKVECSKQTMTDFVKGQTLYTPLAKEWFDAQVVLDA
jgi:hypothetical protein